METSNDNVRPKKVTLFIREP